MSANHNTVAHAWANQTGKHTRGFNMFYDGPTIYSYGRHFAVAKLYPEQGIVLFTSRGYSVSTAKHKSIVSRAIDHTRYTVIPVRNVTGDHDANHAEMIRQIGELMQQSARARAAWKKTMYMDNAEKLRVAANLYRDAFKLTKQPKLPNLEAVDKAATKLRKIAETARKEAEQRQREYARQAKLTDRDRLRDWLQGADVYPPRTLRPYVRIKNNRLETSWGATVDAKPAIAAYRLAKRCRKTGKGFEPAAPHKIGDFTLRAIDKTGAIQVGCHNVPFRFAQLGACLAGIEKTVQIDA